MNQLNSQATTVRNLRILYPFWMLTGMFSIMIVPSMIIIEGDPLETALNLADQEWLFRLGILGSLITQLFYIVIPILLYRLLKDVNQLQAVFMLVFSLVSIPITMYNEVHKISALSLQGDPLEVMAALDLHSQGMIDGMYLSEYAMVVFFLAQSLILARKFSNVEF